MSLFHTFHPQNQSEAYLGDVSLPPPITVDSLSSELVFPIQRQVWDNLQPPVRNNMASLHNACVDADPQSRSVSSGCRNPFILPRHRLQSLKVEVPIRCWWPLNFSGAAGVEGSRSYPVIPLRSHPCLGFSRRGS